MRYAGIDRCDLCNGNDIGASLYVQGCNNHCKGCFNPETWPFDGGKEWTQEQENELFSILEKPYIKRISILGGEPLAPQNIESVMALVKRIRQRFPAKKIWLYTGYDWGTYLLDTYPAETFFDLDYLVDGKYLEEYRDPSLAFRGSSNQHIIDIQETFRRGQYTTFKEKQV